MISIDNLLRDKMIQRSAIIAGISSIALCFLLSNGVANPNMSYPGYITYYGILKVNYEVGSQSGKLICPEEGSNSVIKECQLFRDTLIYALVSIGLGIVSLFVQLKLPVKQDLILFLLLTPIVFTIMMPTWKIIYANEILTYKIIPVLLEFFSFFSYGLAFFIGALKRRAQNVNVRLIDD